MNRSGFVYILALLVVLVVTTVAVTMAEAGGLHLRAGADRSARQQCREAALGVLRAVGNDLDTALAAGRLPQLITVASAGEALGGCTVVILGRDPSGQRPAFGLIPAAGRLDVNAVPAAPLAALPGMTPEIAAAIIDWRDADETPQEGGAERGDGAYAGAAVPYAPRNGPIAVLDELRLVRDVTPLLWAGEDANRNGLLDAGEDADGDGRLAPGLIDLLTVESREPANAPDGSARTRLDRQRDLRARLTALFGAERGAALDRLAQEQQPFANRLDLCAALELSAAEAAALWPCITGPEGRVGLLDAASAPEAVLVAAVGAEWAGRIIAARPADPVAAGPGWLAAALGRDGARAIGHLLTCGSYRFLLDLVAVRDDGAGWARLLAEVDCSAGLARVVSIRPAENLGWPLPAATPERIRRQRPADLPAFLASGTP